MSYQVGDVDVFTTGTVGEPGNRTFYLQFGDAGELITVKLEKQQVAAMAEFLAGLLVEHGEAVAPDEVPLALDLIEPVEPVWVVGAIGAAYNAETDRVIIAIEEAVADDEAEAADEAEADDQPEGEVARFNITRPQAIAYVERARDLVAAGRPPCPFCGRPLDGDGTWCSCHN